ncbi:hypothetical protein FUA23_10400 [Neolewinella aurantiaca]|uniref:Uncharacterized protein n=1 Tax=Neolewinella aurantiaca TaxID=2602767 RepID=A0A5C7FSE3_9BACT|nr:hypothetical protein [Neolewinella aurantiaca]TXF89370.1 hypothetical protein FUA23_10400 [Neolewinella aurantiaca]
MESTNDSDLGQLTIIAYALMAGLGLFAGVVYYLHTSGSQVGSGAIVSETTDLLIVGGIGLMCLTMSRIVSTKVLAAFPEEKRADSDAALNGYRSAVIVRLALLEGAGFVACVFALITGNLNLLLISGFMLVMMWTKRPSATEFAQWRG